MQDHAPDSFRFAGMVTEWRGPAPFHFVPVPSELVQELREAARGYSYGWGVIPADVVVSAATGARAAYATSLFPREGGFLVPLKDKPRRFLEVTLGNEVFIVLTLRRGPASAAVMLVR
ncbi:DUF1905 domain-containing protein [Novosphingobium sp. Chol11]|uniref:DUF1905 domain-containing protein n=1 Tax=Novosphingobium sp. Chol11 TaxID=1385763 RepID=UPI0025E9A5A3|nr:DUF1905 domain-containing protein [Novosphingobium sp. Chol11]